MLIGIIKPQFKSVYKNPLVDKIRKKHEKSISLIKKYKKLK